MMPSTCWPVASRTIINDTKIRKEVSSKRANADPELISGALVNPLEQTVRTDAETQTDELTALSLTIAEYRHGPYLDVPTRYSLRRKRLETTRKIL